MSGHEPERDLVGQPRDPAARWRALEAAIVVGAALVAWRGLLSLHVSGEEPAIVWRLEQGEALTHVFRPLADAALLLLSRLTGGDLAPAGFVFVALVHAANAWLVLELARALGVPRPGTWLAAALFAVGGGVADSLGWLAAINRPLSTFGALVALLGVVRYARPRDVGGGAPRDLVLFAAGFAWQYVTNEEVYGTAAIAAAWLVLRAPLGKSARIALALVPPAAVVLHYVVFSGAARGAALAGHLGWRGIVDGVLERHAGLGRGFGLDGAPTAAVFMLAAVSLAATARGRGVLAFALLFLAGALVPFALDPGPAYRDYPSQAPFALLVGAAIGIHLASVRGRTALAAALVALAIFASEAPRAERLAAWRAATAPLAALDAALAERPGVAPDALLNLDTTAAGLLLHRLGADAAASPEAAFLDAPSGAAPDEEAAQLATGTWLGRRHDGTIGWIDEPGAYLAGRPRLPGVTLVERSLLVPDADAARAAVRSVATDLTTTVVLEPGPGELAAPPTDRASAALGVARVVEPVEPHVERGILRLVVDVEAERPAWLVVQEPWLWLATFRYAPDAALAQGVHERRVLVPAARDLTGDTPLATRRANVLGAAALVPAGARRVEFTWRLATSAEVRSPEATPPMAGLVDHDGR